MARPKVRPQFMVDVVVYAEIHGDDQAAAAYDIVPRTVIEYRKRVRETPKLSEALTLTLRKLRLDEPLEVKTVEVTLADARRGLAETLATSNKYNQLLAFHATILEGYLKQIEQRQTPDPETGELISADVLEKIALAQEVKGLYPQGMLEAMADLTQALAQYYKVIDDGTVARATLEAYLEFARITYGTANTADSSSPYGERPGQDRALPA